LAEFAHSKMIGVLFASWAHKGYTLLDPSWGMGQKEDMTLEEMHYLDLARVEEGQKRQQVCHMVSHREI